MARRKSSRHQVITVPYIAYADYGKDVSVTAAMLLGSGMFDGSPWRLLSVYAEAVVITTACATAPQKSSQPVFVQVSLNTAQTDNVEAVVSRRWLTTMAQSRSRRLVVPGPNPWKEDEDRSQALIVIENLTFGTGCNTTVAVHIEAKFQFGPILLTNPKGLRNNRLSPEEEAELLKIGYVALR